MKASNRRARQTMQLSVTKTDKGWEIRSHRYFAFLPECDCREGRFQQLGIDAVPCEKKTTKVPWDERKDKRRWWVEEFRKRKIYHEEDIHVFVRQVLQSYGLRLGSRRKRVSVE